MATVHIYRWTVGLDTIWHVCSRHLLEAGFGDLPDFVEAVRAANPLVHDWQAVPDQTRIVLPFPS